LDLTLGKLIFQKLTICLFLLAGITIHAQNLDKKITIEAHNQPLGEIIKQVGEKGNILFSYNPNTIPIDKKITVVAYNTPLSKIFVTVFTANGIDYTITEKQVILKLQKNDQTDKPESLQTQPRKYTLSGYVKDKATGDRIIGANIYDVASQQGTSTNAYGFYSLSLPPGEHQIANSFVGYTPVSRRINLTKNIEEIIELEPSPIVMNTIVITAQTEDDMIAVKQSGNNRLSPSVLKQIPGFAGNVDVLKSLQNIPGIVSFGDGSAFYYVRGGNSDQNLMLIDEAPIYNPSHMFGFFSALAPDAIKDVTVYKGDFPANYGGRLSSVVDVRAREGNQKRFGFAGNIGPYTSDITLEGPILKEKSSFLVSGRRSNINWMKVPANEQQTYTFNFYDLNSKFNININKNNRLFLTAFAGSDIFERTNKLNENTFGISWKNVAGVVRWNHVFNSRLFSNTTAYLSRYNYFLDLSKELRKDWNSSISNATIKTDFSWYLNPSNTIKTGFEVNGHQSNLGNISSAGEQTQINTKYQSTEFGFYASNEQRIGNRLFARYGIRFTKWNDLGPTSIYFFDGNHNVIDTIKVAKNTIYKSFFNTEPRLNLRYVINDKSSLQFNYNHTVQHLQVLSNSTSPFTSLEMWVPSGPNIKPQQADQFSLGYFSKVFYHQFDFSLETYYKKLYNQIDYKDHANMLVNPLVEGELRFGDGWSYGIEALLRKSRGKFTGWISYTYSRTMKQIADVNAGNAYPSAYDRPHNICITMSYVSNKHWNFSAHWMYLTGAPFTSPIGFYYTNGYTIPLYGEKHNDRYPNYHRLDLSIAYTLSKPEKRFQHNLMLTVYNAYGRHNPFSVNFNKIMDDNGNIVVPTNLEGDVELIPTTISVAGVIPSLNYTFRF